MGVAGILVATMLRAATPGAAVTATPGAGTPLMPDVPDAGITGMGRPSPAPGTVSDEPAPLPHSQYSTLPAELNGATLIDQVVARVNRHPITRSQLDLEARLALAEHDNVTEAEQPLSAGELSSALDYLIDQLLLDDEAERLQVFEVSDEEARLAAQKLAEHFPSPKAYANFLARYSISLDAVESTARRGLRAERYLDDKIRVQVQGGASEAEAQAVAKELVGQLRARAEVRILSKFGTAKVGMHPPRGTETPVARP